MSEPEEREMSEGELLENLDWFGREVVPEVRDA